MEHRAVRSVPSSQIGAALAIGLILLLIVTLLGATGMRTAATELVMAGNTQYHHDAAQAASAGIEYAIAELRQAHAVSDGAPRIVENAPAFPGSRDTYSTITRFLGEERGLPQSSADKLVGLHFEIESTARSVRRAQDVQVQGVIVIAPLGGGGRGFEPLRQSRGP